MNDEFALIRLIAPKSHFREELIQGIGDDAALFQMEDAFASVAAADMFVEGIHFKRETMNVYHVGFKALAANLSDLAAMGAIPMFYLVSIAIPKTGFNKIELQDLYQGMGDLASEFQVDLIGGDTVATLDALAISVTAIGKVEKTRRLLRSNAQKGDVIFVTGSLGGSAAGLSLLLEKGKNSTYGEQEMRLIEQHIMPKPQIHAGRIFAKLNCRVALNDISDGIASEAYEIAEASGKKLIIDFEKIPKHPALRLFSKAKAEQFVLYGGEDFQLLGCVSEQNWRDVQSRFKAAGIPLAEIGYVEDGKAGVYLLKNGVMEKLQKRGYNHFKPNESGVAE